MGNIVFTARRIIESAPAATWVAEGGDLTLGATGLVKQLGDSGVDLLIGDVPQQNQMQKARVLDAWFAKKEGDNYIRISAADIQDDVFVVVQTSGLVGKEVELNVLDRDGVIVNAYAALPALQDQKDKSGRFAAKVDQRNRAIFALSLKAKEDKTTETWRTKIAASKHKKAFLCLLVDAGSKNPGMEIAYNGKNPSNDQASAKATKTNYWLDTEGDWFELRPKTPVVVLDPGHGYRVGNTGAVSFIYTYRVRGADGKAAKDPKSGQVMTARSNVMELPQYVLDDPATWIISKREDPDRSERFLVYDICSRFKSLLETEGYKVLLTRERGPLEGSDNSASRAARIAIAHDNEADYFISVHADGADSLTATGSHVIYPASSDEQINTDSAELGRDIFSAYTIVAVGALSPKQDVRGLQVLGNSNKTKRKVLLELGFITSPADARALYSNIDTIASQLTTGFRLNVNKYF